MNQEYTGTPNLKDIDVAPVFEITEITANLKITTEAQSEALSCDNSGCDSCGGCNNCDS